jgi:peptidylprolyl isomerase
MRITSRTPVIAVFMLTLFFISCRQGERLPDGLYARIRTVHGDILIRLEHEKAPLTVCTFAGLAEGRLNAAGSKHFYDGLTFHRVEPGFVVQGGDPEGTGRGGPGFTIPNETVVGSNFDAEGIVGMANAGMHRNGSQFFITLAAAPHLDGAYTAFGSVVSGMEAVKKIQPGDVMKKVEILRSGAAAASFKTDQKAWDRLYNAAVQSKRAADLTVIHARWPNLSAEETGLLSKCLEEGTGPAPSRGQTLSVAYKLMLMSGEVIDSSDMHGGSVDFQVGAGRLIAGMDTALLGMKQGERRLFVIPPELGYGSIGIPGTAVEPFAFLVFEAKIIRIK